MKYLTLQVMKIMANYQNGFIVRNPKKITRLYIDNEFVDDGYLAYSKNAGRIYFVLARHANAKTQTCFPSYPTLMRKAGMKNRNSVSQAIKELEQLNVIKIKKTGRGRANTYFLIDNQYWKTISSINGDTTRPVSKIGLKQYQKTIQTSIALDTLSQQSKSTKINQEKDKILEAKNTQTDTNQSKEEHRKAREKVNEIRKRLVEKFTCHTKI